MTGAQVLAAIDLAKNELSNARVQNLATAPGPPVAGQLYYDTVLNNLYFWDGTTWQATAGGASGAAGGSLTGTYPNPTIAAGAITTRRSPPTPPSSCPSWRSTRWLGPTTPAPSSPATISDFDAQVRTSRLDQMAAPTAAVSLNSQRLTNLADPTSAQDAATKAYVDAAPWAWTSRPRCGGDHGQHHPVRHPDDRRRRPRRR
jgi:hypothetical protein